MTTTIDGQAGGQAPPTPSVLRAVPCESGSAGRSGFDQPNRLLRPPSAGAGLRDLTFASVLAVAAERMHSAQNVADLWETVVSEAVLLIPADAAALMEYRQGAWRLRETRPSDVQSSAAVSRADIAAVVEHGLLSPTNGMFEASSLPSTNGISWPALLIARLAGVSRRNPMRLVWFSRTPAAFSSTVDIAGIFIRHVDAVVESVQARDTLSEAVAARHHIGIAQGILMSRYGWTAGQAFSVLGQLSQHTNVKVRSVADQVIETGALPDPIAHSPQAPQPAESRTR